MKFLLLLAPLVLLSACESRRNTALHGTEPGTQLRNGALVLDLRTDKPAYRLGDPVQLTLSASQRCNVEIWSEDPKGNCTIIWPRPGEKPNPLPAGQTLRLPPQGATWKLAASKPTGINTLVAKAVSAPLASSSHHPFNPSEGTEHPFFHTGIWKGVHDTRGLQVVNPPASDIRPSLGRKPVTGEARLLYEVVE